MAIFNAYFDDDFLQAFDRLDNSVKLFVNKRILKILENPFLSKPLHGRERIYSERLLNYRIVFEIDGECVMFLKFGKRDEVYRAR